MNAIAVTNISNSFTYNMAAKINWRMRGTKLRHYRMCTAIADLFIAVAEVRLFGAGEYFPE